MARRRSCSRLPGSCRAGVHTNRAPHDPPRLHCPANSCHAVSGMSGIATLEARNRSSGADLAPAHSCRAGLPSDRYMRGTSALTRRSRGFPRGIYLMNCAALRLAVHPADKGRARTLLPGIRVLASRLRCRSLRRIGSLVLGAVSGAGLLTVLCHSPGGTPACSCCAGSEVCPTGYRACSGAVRAAPGGRRRSAAPASAAAHVLSPMPAGWKE